MLTHIRDGDLIYIQPDQDADGYTSSALLLNYLYRRFPSSINNFHYHCHDKKVHGINLDYIPEGTKLVLCPDSSSNECQTHQALAEKGIDIVILDHHHAPQESPYACVVNNQLCDYPTKSLSGVGIVYKFCQYIDSLFGDNLADEFLDIVALGNLGDMMDLRPLETHYLVNEGLKHIENPFIAGMIKKNEYSIGSKLTPMGLVFYVVPLINAVARIGSLEDKTLLFESMLDFKAHEMIPSTKRGHKGEQEERVEQAIRMCTNTKSHQTKEQNEAAEQVKKVIEKEGLDKHKVIIVRVDNPAFNRGILGLIANRVMAEYKKPIILVSKDSAGDYSGSARACGIEDLRGLVEKSRLVKLAEGQIYYGL